MPYRNSCAQRTILLVCFVITVMAPECFAQTKQVLSQGTRYVVAFPEVMASPTEKPMPQPMMVFISSRFNAKVRVFTPTSDTGITQINKTYSIKANTVLRIPIPITLMNSESQRIRGKGVEIVSDRPITVSTWQAWMGNGELATHLPVAGWGKEYYTMNMYQDRYGTEGTGYKYRPSQILVIAAYDGTDVSYTPTFQTEGGAIVPSTPKGSKQVVRLNRGETFQIKDAINEAKCKDWEADLSGTLISASKPIAVVSGHVKCAILRYPDVIPPTATGKCEANFIRSNVHDVMIPTDLAGTSFVSIACQYTPVRDIKAGTSGASFGIEDDRGDLIRVVAIADGTTVRAMAVDGSGLVSEWNLNKGQTRTVSRDYSVYWESNKPVLMGQYGKSFAKIFSGGGRVISKQDDETMGGVSIDAGMPMLQSIPPIHRWINYATFHSPEGMDNFFNIVYKAGEIGAIKIDGRALTAAFGGAQRFIPGTPYAYIRTPIGPGDHYVQSTDSNVRWCAWNYGSLDGLSQGRAYGSPIGVDLAIPCDDELSVSSKQDCGTFVIDATVRSTGTGTASMYELRADSLLNFTYTYDTLAVPGTRASATVSVVDANRPAQATITVLSRSGNSITRTFTYRPDSLTYSPPSIDFSSSLTGAVRCAEVFLTNTGSAPVSISNIVAKLRPEHVRVTPSNLVIQPYDRARIQVCSELSDPRPTVDTLIISTNCQTIRAVELRTPAAQPEIQVSDQRWEATPSNLSQRKDVVIKNKGYADLVISDYERSKVDPTDTRNHFVNPVGLDATFPIIIAPNDSLLFSIEYDPRDEYDTLHTEQITFFSNAQGSDSVCLLQGMLVKVSSAGDDTWNAAPRIISVAPQPATDVVTVTLSSHDISNLALYDQLGACVWQSDIAIAPFDARGERTVIIGLQQLPSGVYRLLLHTHGVVFTTKMVVHR